MTSETDILEAIRRALDSEEARPAGEVGRAEWFLDALREQGFDIVRQRLE
jgi:hypothetical protein